MKLEIAHDSLAKHIYEKASAEDKMRKKIADFIHTRYNFYKENNNKPLLKSDDLNYIQPYYQTIELPQEEKVFVRKSQEAEKRRLRLAWAVGIALFLVLSATTGLALWSRQVAKTHEANLKIERDEKDRLNKRLELEKNQIETLNTQLNKQIERNQALADSLAAKEGLTVNLDSLSEDQKKAMIITLVGNRKELENKNEELQKMYERIIEREKHKIKAEKEKEKAVEIKKAKEAEAKRIQKLLEQKHLQLMQQKEQELKRAKSVALSAKALTAFEQGDLKTAFQLASEAYELDKKNKEAIEILQKIARKQTDVFGRKYGPSLSDPEQIIKRFRKTYGRTSSSIIQRKYFQQR